MLYAPEILGEHSTQSIESMESLSSMRSIEKINSTKPNSFNVKRVDPCIQSLSICRVHTKILNIIF